MPTNTVGHDIAAWSDEQRKAFSTLQAKAAMQGKRLDRTDTGFMLAWGRCCSVHCQCLQTIAVLIDRAAAAMHAGASAR